MSGRQGRAPIQGLGSTASPSGKSSRAFGSARAICTGVGGGIAIGEFGAGGQPDATHHRGQQEAAVDVEHRPVQYGIALRRKC